MDMIIKISIRVCLGFLHNSIQQSRVVSDVLFIAVCVFYAVSQLYTFICIQLGVCLRIIIIVDVVVVVVVVITATTSTTKISSPTALLITFNHVVCVLSMHIIPTARERITTSSLPSRACFPLGGTGG